MTTFDISPSILMILCCKIKTTTTATYGLLSWLLRYFGFHLFVTLCAPACGSPPATPTPSACLPPSSPPSAPTPAPATCHPSLSLFSVLPFFAAGPLSIPLPRPPPPRQVSPPRQSSLPPTARRHLFIPDEFQPPGCFCLCQATCNKNPALDFAPRITSEHVLVPLLHDHA